MIILEVQDDAGNCSRKAVTITAGTRTSSKFTDVSTSWAAGYINLLSDRGIMNVRAIIRWYLAFQSGAKPQAKRICCADGQCSGIGHLVGIHLPFDDAASIPDWAKASIAAVTEAGVMSGQSNPEYWRSQF